MRINFEDDVNRRMANLIKLMLKVMQEIDVHGRSVNWENISKALEDGMKTFDEVEIARRAMLDLQIDDELTKKELAYLNTQRLQLRGLVQRLVDYLNEP